MLGKVIKATLFIILYLENQPWKKSSGQIKSNNKVRDNCECCVVCDGWRGSFCLGWPLLLLLIFCSLCSMRNRYSHCISTGGYEKNFRVLLLILTLDEWSWDGMGFANHFTSTTLVLFGICDSEAQRKKWCRKRYSCSQINISLKSRKLLNLTRRLFQMSNF